MPDQQQFGSKVERAAYNGTSKLLTFLGRGVRGVVRGVYDTTLKPAGQSIAKAVSKLGEDGEEQTPQQ